MFPERRRRSRALFPHQNRRRSAPKSRFHAATETIADFRNSVGQMDIEKLYATGKQAMDVYKQVSPYIAKLKK
ncbi:YppG family protein [Lentibacillus sediminis]|uniref:YppG family protein n=1 Tax=Lentibacillus sediminis TaxID=1940529 RepID=UPI000C1BAB44|nr:YppG family protein [Lentibacillus sediminis]